MKTMDSKYIVVIRAHLCPVTWVEDAWADSDGERQFLLTRLQERLAHRYDSQEEAQKDAVLIFEANKQYGLSTSVQAVRS